MEDLKMLKEPSFLKTTGRLFHNLVVTTLKDLPPPSQLRFYFGHIKL